MKKRNSSLELLKIFAMCLIALNHALPFYGDVNSISFFEFGVASTSLENIFLNILRCSGNIGNIIFVMCSCYFLVESKNSKKEKILSMIMDSLVISLLWILPFIFIDIDITTKDIIKQFAPITFKNNWFIGCYLLLYAIHPLLNKIIDNIDKKQFFRINIVLIVLYSGMHFFKNGLYYYSELVGFIYIYFLIAYMKKYMENFRNNEKLNYVILVLSILGNICLIFMMNYLGLKNGFFADKVLHWNSFTNPLFILTGITLLNIFNNKYFYNRIINYIASLSFLFYLIHENMLFRQNLKPLFYQKVFLNGDMIFWIFIEAIVLFIGGNLLALLYKETIQKILYKMIQKIYNFLKKGYLKIEKKLLCYF